MQTWDAEADRRPGGAVRAAVVAVLIALGVVLAAVGAVAAGDDPATSRGSGRGFFWAQDDTPGANEGGRDCPHRNANETAPEDPIL